MSGIIRPKIFKDPLEMGRSPQIVPYTIDTGASGLIDIVAIDGAMLFRVRVDPFSAAPVSALTLSGLGRLPSEFAWLENIADGVIPDGVWVDTADLTEFSFVFTNGLAPGQASRWIVDTRGGAAFESRFLGSVTDASGASSVPQPLLAALPEPASALLLLPGLLALSLRRRARRPGLRRGFGAFRSLRS